MSAISGTQAIWYKSMCTQRRMPLPNGGPADPQVGVTTHGGSVTETGGDGEAGPQNDIPLADAGGGNVLTEYYTVCFTGRLHDSHSVFNAILSNISS